MSQQSISNNQVITRSDQILKDNLKKDKIKLQSIIKTRSNSLFKNKNSKNIVQIRQNKQQQQMQQNSCKVIESEKHLLIYETLDNIGNLWISFPAKKERKGKKIYRKKAVKQIQIKQKQITANLFQEKTCQNLEKDTSKIFNQSILQIDQEDIQQVKQSSVQNEQSQNSHINKELTFQIDYNFQEIQEFQSQDSTFDSLNIKKTNMEDEQLTESTKVSENASIEPKIQQNVPNYIKNMAIIPEFRPQIKEIKLQKVWEAQQISNKIFQQCLNTMKQMFGNKRHDEDVAQLLKQSNNDIKKFNSLLNEKQMEMKNQFQETDQRNKPYNTRKKNSEKKYNINY